MAGLGTKVLACCFLWAIETENELLLDSGDTRKERKLYLREMIARFAHHPQKGSNAILQGGKFVNLGAPPSDVDKDWVALVKKR